MARAATGKTGTSGQTTTVIYDDLIDLIHSVNSAYRARGARFMMGLGGAMPELAASIDTLHASNSLELGTDIVTPPESRQTTHFSVIDADGNAVSSTYTLEGGYGSGGGGAGRPPPK